MDIKIITNDNQRKHELNPNCPIKNIKVKIQSETSIPTDWQHFFYNNQELKDDKTLKDYKIRQGACILNKISKTPIDDNFISQQNEFQQRKIQPTSQQDQHQSKSQNEEKEETEMRKIEIKDLSGNFSTYMVRNDDSIFSLKVQISERINVFPDHIYLLRGGKFLKDEGLVDQYITKDNSIINLITENDYYKIINLNFVNMNGCHQFSLKFIPKYQIKDLILQISKLLNIKTHQISLFYKKTELHEDEYLIHHLVHDGSTIKLNILEVPQGSFPIHVKLLTGKRMVLDVLPTNKLGEIVSKISEKEEIPIDSIRLVWKGRRIFKSDFDITVEEKGIKQDDTLHMVLGL